MKKASDVEKCVTLSIKTFERPECLKKLVNSIRQYYPNIRVVISDDSKNPELIEGTDHFTMPFYSGSSAGRNLGLSKIETEYMVTLDDDFVFTTTTRLEEWVKILDNTTIDLVSGNVDARRFEGLIDLSDRKCRLIHGSRGEEGELKLYDVVLQFWMGRTDIIQSLGGWDEEFRTQDHKIFFARHLGKLKIAHYPRVFVHHNRMMPKEYVNYRHGKCEQNFLKLMMEKLDVDIIEEFGTVTARR